jgi:trehalose 6-phosphate synthase/phosphatase
MAVPSEQTLKALSLLSEDPRNVVYIISGRDGDFLEEHLGHLDNMGFSAEHGGFLREPGSKKWRNFTEKLDMSWMGEVNEIFKYYTEVCGGLCLASWAGADELGTVTLSVRREVSLNLRRAR